MELALSRTDVDPTEMNKEMHNLKMDLAKLKLKFFGSQAKNEVGERNNPTIYNRISAAQMGTNNSTYGPTPTHKRSLEIARKEFKVLRAELTENN
jgi:hypothetical protein